MSRALPACLAILLAAPALCADDKADPAKQFAEILKPYNELVAKYKVAKTDDEKKLIQSDSRQVIAEVGPKLLDLARANPGTPTAVNALMWFVEREIRTEETKEAKKLLVANYLTSDRIGRLCKDLEDDTAKGEQYLREIRERNPNKAVKLLAGVSLGRFIAAKPNPTEESLREVEAMLVEVRDEGRKLKGFPEDRLLAADKALFELRSLTVGKTPPELDGTTVEGKKAKLSDYRGKVLVLTVWATHAVPAREIIPGQRILAQKYAGKPFAMLSVSCDAEKSRLTEFLKKEPMPWDHWWNGQKGGILETWTVTFYPTVYVFDAKGVIRYKNLNPQKLDEAVEVLLNEK